MIPKKLHIIWVGDETKRPDNCIATWRALNPSWELKVWGNDSLQERGWINGDHMMAMSDRELNGVADMMRWEIVYEHGGVVVDADSICVKPLDDELLDCEAFACWESEIARPGLIAAGYFGAKPQNPFVGQIIQDIHAEKTVIDRMAWETVGPQRLTDTFRKYRYHGLKIYPSHYFIPEHFSGVHYNGTGPVYARQLWGSTKRSYDHIHLIDVDGNGAPKATQAAAAAAPAPVAPARPAPTAPATPAALRPTASPLEAKHDPYFVQKVQVSTELIGLNRVGVLRAFCEGKRVLHVGCADWPITNPANSLHIALEQVCAKLDGFDIHEEAMEALAPYCKGRLFSNFDDVTDEYDIVLVPEVMEHVGSVADFLETLSKVKATTVLLSVPDAYQCQKRHFDYVETTGTFVEVVHPDHNCWYTPYTLQNTLAKYTSWKMERMWFFNNISLLTMLTMAPVDGEAAGGTEGEAAKEPALVG